MHIRSKLKAEMFMVDISIVYTIYMKIQDYFLGNIDIAIKEKWWKMLVSAGSLTDNIRYLCLEFGIILVDPELLPLPILIDERLFSYYMMASFLYKKRRFS